MRDYDQNFAIDDRAKHGGGRGSEPSSAFAVLFMSCIAIVLVSIAVSCHAVVRIMKTTGAFGVLVDARGIPIPAQGYLQLGFGLWGVLLFSILAVLIGLHRARQRNIPRILDLVDQGVPRRPGPVKDEDVA